MQQDMGERKGNWMVIFQEFDMDIKPAKLFKGQGLCKLAIEAQDQVNEDPRWDNKVALWCGKASYIYPGEESWYEKLTYLLHHGTFLEDLNPRERRSLRLKSTQYCLINSLLF
jgi:hypothetical protein